MHVSSLYFTMVISISKRYGKHPWGYVVVENIKDSRIERDISVLMEFFIKSTCLKFLSIRCV